MLWFQVCLGTWRPGGLWLYYQTLEDVNLGQEGDGSELKKKKEKEGEEEEE